MKTLSGNRHVTYRSAVQQDYIDFYGERLLWSARSIAFFYDGVVVGLGGYKIHNGSYVIFSDIAEGDYPKLSVWRCAKIVMKMIGEVGTPMYAVAENDGFCERLGMNREEGDLYTWQV